MLLVGLTGGIGSGKSTVAGMLEDRGAVVLDADEFARRAVAAGTPGFRHVVDTFGRRVIAEDGEIDRARLARIVFAEPQDRERLEAIVHPEVARLLHEELQPYRDTDRVVVYAVPLLVENGLQSMFAEVVVVTAPEDLRVERLMARGMAEDDARARIRAQLTDDEREAVATHVLRNDSSVEGLERQVDELWAELAASRSIAPRTEGGVSS